MRVQLSAGDTVTVTSIVPLNMLINTSYLFPVNTPQINYINIIKIELVLLVCSKEQEIKLLQKTPRYHLML